MKKGEKRGEIKSDRFPASLFWIYLIVLFLMSGFHTGIIVLANTLEWNKIIQVVIAILYWFFVAVGLTLFTRNKIQKNYEKPMHDLAEATKKIAEGDFSVYVPTINTSDRLDYLDIMIIDFNKMVEELGSIETLKTDFFSNVSHEIKTPLAIIQNNAELLCMETEPKKQKEYAEIIFQTTKRLSELISNILKLNKLEKQAIVPMTEEYDLCGQLAECALNYEAIWEKKGIEFDADMEDHVKITADASLMELVWNNLLSNAVKFTEPGGIIKLTEWSGEKQICVSVEDNGCGMSEETQKHIFEKFYQGDTSHAMAGNGLGLALAMRVLQLNDYRIEVESSPGSGSKFTVLIPKGEKKEHE
ncbi:signal transduction histidine kinase [Faecalimonas umbilicata]|uniref:histidine kinase n=1 Tax=Faecalimonas umbilicata TaxID=1912855 RepID=A0A4V2UN87_9FIRM|nr:HAMP domain-containing sensor histidine kinase [Faecalimonas umbilicata]TCS61031.1 signal transduction histidine kinase [Faecalimonas umbilicata]GBU06123.1 two component sensor kinase [Faecalimonas umbilicata]